MRVLLWTLKSSYAVFPSNSSWNVIHTQRVQFDWLIRLSAAPNPLHIVCTWKWSLFFATFEFSLFWFVLTSGPQHTIERERETHRVVNKSKARFRGGDDASFKRSASEMIDSNIVYFKFCWTFFRRERCVNTFRAKLSSIFSFFSTGKGF